MYRSTGVCTLPRRSALGLALIGCAAGANAHEGPESLVLDKLSVTGFVNNLTDRRYQVLGRPNGTAGQYVITYGDPRTVGLSVTSRF